MVICAMLDFATRNIPSVNMSRKRTRSRSEDSIFSGGVKLQTVMSICKETPYSHEPEALAAKNACDYSIKITEELAKSGKAPRPVRVYADGAYDLFHQGHAKQMRQAKNVFPNVYLIAGVCSDTVLHEVKGHTVMKESERYDAIRHCRYVDEVLCAAPWVITEDFLEEHKIDFVAHDDMPYPCGDISDVYAPLKAKGMFVATTRTEGVSTSDIVARIIRDYDVYVRRNLERGYSATDLNISYLKEKRIRLKGKMSELKDKGLHVIDSIGEKTDDMVTRWEAKSKDFIDSFLKRFYKGNLSIIWQESKNKILNAISAPESDNQSSSNNSYSNHFQQDDYIAHSKKIKVTM